jgi:hypothetical protein
MVPVWRRISGSRPHVHRSWRSWPVHCGCEAASSQIRSSLTQTTNAPDPTAGGAASPCRLQAAGCAYGARGDQRLIIQSESLRCRATPTGCTAGNALVMRRDSFPSAFITKPISTARKAEPSSAPSSRRGFRRCRSSSTCWCAGGTRSGARSATRSAQARATSMPALRAATTSALPQLAVRSAARFCQAADFPVRGRLISSPFA